MAEREQKTPLDLSNASIGQLLIVRAEFNTDITGAQLQSATDLLDQYGIAYDVKTVPGSFEIPHTVERALQKKAYDGVITLGCLVKGESIHFEVIAYALAKQLMELSVNHAIPLGFGIITALDRKQAEERTWLGEDAAYAVLSSLAG